MALSTTTNYSLRKHDAGDLNWDVDVNWNMTEIDKKLKLLFANFLTCSTAIGTAAKTAAFTNFMLETGCLIAVKFTNGNSASGVTLNVNSTGAKAIQVNGAAVAVGAIIPNGVYLLAYDGTNWAILNPITLSDSITDGETGLAPSQNAVFDALALKANAGDVTTSLALKADLTALNTEKQLLIQEIDSLKKSAIENSNAPYLTASGYGDVTLAKNSVGVGTMGIDGVTVENVLVNGAFSDGTIGWSRTGSSLSVLNRVLNITGTGQAEFVRAASYYTIVLNTKYYVRGKARVTNSSAIELRIRFMGGHKELVTANPVENQWYQYSTIYNNITYSSHLMDNYVGHSYTTKEIALGKVAECEGMMILNLTALGLDSLTVEQVDHLVDGGYFDGKQTFGGVGCLVSKDSAEVEVGRMYFNTDPMYSNATAKDTLTYSGGKYYHTHNVDSDGNAIATPYDTEVETNGQFLALSNGTVTYEPWYPDIAVYTDKFTLTKAITAVKELYKYGSETPITDAVIAGDGLSLTSASLTAGDLAYGVFEFDEPLRPLMTIKSRNDDATVVDTVTGTVYTFRPVVTNGAIASWELTEV